jgi:class 3 adenylate cyclase
VRDARGPARGRAPREAATPPKDADAAARGERRQLTVLFCDLVGSTPLSQQIDAEGCRDVVTRYQKACGEQVARFGGHVAQYLGDGLLVYFGWPTAHEDDPERGVRAGLALLGAMDALNAALPAGDATRLSVRIGLHTGPMVIGEMGRGAKSEVLALAPRPPTWRRESRPRPTPTRC